MGFQTWHQGLAYFYMGMSGAGTSSGPQMSGGDVIGYVVIVVLGLKRKMGTHNARTHTHNAHAP
eukprot:3158091-Amphidinium_carterae.1